ncbi:TPR repeat-containing protein [Calothrix sp. NIES-4101]|nr:TPR repeat-containing protein [Calothrix sp. NIES-4101]
MWNFLQPIAKFYTDNKEFIDNLISGGLPAMIPVVAGFIWWLKSRNRQRKIPPNTFAFEVIAPQGVDLASDVKKRILGGHDKDALADRNIHYQQRVENRNIRKELREELEAHRWVLVLGRTGIGKTREALEVAEYYNGQGWTVLFLKTNEWLDIPAKMPAEVGTDRKLLFVIDDLNRKMHRSRVEISPEAEKSPVEKFTVPLQERLLDALTRYEVFCGKVEVRVIATARNEREADFLGEISPWEQLQWEKYPKLWQKFHVYELPQPNDDAVIRVLVETVKEAGISANSSNYSEIARRNDSTFRNAIENLRRLKADNLPLNTNNYRDTLRDTWEGNYKKAVKRYPQAVHIYDAVDLLRQFNISLYDFTVAATARMLAGGNFWQQLQNRWQIRQAMRFLIASEGILEPRDGQIEAKGYEVEKERYIQRLLPLILKLANQHPEKVTESLFYFGNALTDLGRYEDAVASYNEVLKFSPYSHEAWYNQGITLGKLGRFEDAVASYDKAVKIQPDYYQPWNNRGTTLAKLGRLEEAITSYNEALKFKADYQAFYNRGNALANLGRYEEAIAAYDEAVKIQPDYQEAFYNRGYALANLGRYEEAIAAYDKALKFKADYQAFYNRGYALANLGRYEEAIAAYDKAVKIQPDDDGAWNNRGTTLAKLGRYEEAVTSFHEALQFKPDDHQTWYNRGNALANLGRYEEAITSYDQALQFKPDEHAAWNNRGNALVDLGRYGEAIASYDQALKFKPDSHEAWNNRGYALWKLGKLEDAIKSYDKAIEINPEYANAFYNRACAYCILDNINLALQDLQTAINLDAEYREMAKTDTDFDSIRNNAEFEILINQQ